MTPTKENPANQHKASAVPEELCRNFSFSEIKMATDNFNEAWIIGRGGYGSVYRGYIDDGSRVVAVKRHRPGSKQGSVEFQSEIKSLSLVRYVHLVSLIGYCVEVGEMILVYEYVENGSLRDHLNGADNDPLTWKQRLEICVGAARGLHYLHTGIKRRIIHRDVKSMNILLDDKWVAKITDFGLSKKGPNDTVVRPLAVKTAENRLDGKKIAKRNPSEPSEIHTMVKGTFGYLDPEYARNQQLTDKSDVYSFGVVLFEVLCARKPLDIKLDEAQRNLAYWAGRCIMDGTIQNIIDPFLMGKIAPECFKKFVEVAASCIRGQRIQRPTMGDVMEKLESALELQEQADAKMKEMNPDGDILIQRLSFRVSDIHVPMEDVSDSDASGSIVLRMETKVIRANCMHSKRPTLISNVLNKFKLKKKKNPCSV